MIHVCIMHHFSYWIILESLMPRDCKEWYDLGIRKDGVYPVNPGNDVGFQVSIP